jgi:hypothetical protein
MDTNDLDEMVENGADIEIDAGDDEEINTIESEEDDDDLDVVSIEGETPPDQEEEVSQKAPTWVRDLRKSYRAQQAENQKLKEELNRVKQPVQTNSSAPIKPKLEDFDYDAEEYEAAIDKWHSEKIVHESAEKEKAKIVEQQQKDWQVTLDSYAASRNSLKVPDFEMAEEVVTNKLSIEQQTVILQGAKNPAAVVYALGKNKAKIEELSKITNPIKFAFALAELQGKLNVSRKSAPAPEKSLRGTASSVSSDATLDRLRDEATKSGDTSKLMAYKRSLKNK